jgi:tyrosine-protein phosphatase YwqE
VDDGAKDWDQSLEMERLAVNDGITVMVATPHLFKGRTLDLSHINDKDLILQHVAQLRQKLAEAAIPLKIIPGCDFPLGFESLQLLEDGRALTINDAHDPKRRPPLLSKAVTELSRLLGKDRARAMVHDLPGKIIAGEPCP